jgi:hypothetical protein
MVRFGQAMLDPVGPTDHVEAHLLGVYSVLVSGLFSELDTVARREDYPLRRPAMTATYSAAPTLLVAIDISKHRHEVLIGAPGKTRRRRMTITNTLDDFGRLVATLSGYGLPVRIGFEATGNYHRALAHHLGQAGFELKLVSSVGLARTREVLHNRWDKNAPKDAQVILHMLEVGAVQFIHDPRKFRNYQRPMRSFRSRRPNSGTASRPITCLCIFPKPSGFTEAPRRIGSWRFSRSTRRHT